MDEQVTKDEQALGGEVFLSWCGALLVLVSGAFLGWWLSPIHSALVLLPNMSVKGFHNGGI